MLEPASPPVRTNGNNTTPSPSSPSALTIGETPSAAFIQPGQRIAVITASTAGIGLASAYALSARGYHVVISSRDLDRVSDAVAALREEFGFTAASGLVCHVGQAEDRVALVRHATALARYAARLTGTSAATSTANKADNVGISALVLNAAASTAYGPVLKTTEKQWDKIFDTNVRSTFLLVSAFEPLLVRGSSVLIVSSIAGYVSLPGLGAYSVSKTALLGLVKVLAVELGRRGVRVNGVSPGIIRTRFSERLWKGENSVAEQATSGKREGAGKAMFIPLRRIGEPDDVSGLVAFLVSDEARYITGENVVVAGGAASKL